MQCQAPQNAKNKKNMTLLFCGLLKLKVNLDANPFFFISFR